MSISSQQSIALAPDPVEWGPGNLPSTIHTANLESAIHCTRTGSTRAYLLQCTVRVPSQKSIAICIRTKSTWGSGLTPYNSQCESRVSNPLHLYRVYRVFRTYLLQFTVRIPSQQSIALAPDLPGVQELPSIIHSANPESAIHCTRTGTTWCSRLTGYNSQCESRVSNPLHSHRIYLGSRTYLL